MNNGTLLVIIIVLLLQLRTKKIRLFSLWIMPVLILIYTVLSILKIANIMPGDILLFVAALTTGAVLGIIRGNMTNLKVDENTNQIISKASNMSVLLWLCFIAVKYSVEWIFRSSGTRNVMLITNAFLCLALGMIFSRRFVMQTKYLLLKSKRTIWWRCKEGLWEISRKSEGNYIW